MSLSMSGRETVLAWLTLAILLGASTYFLGEAKLDEWKNINKSRASIEEEIAFSQRLVDQRDVWQERLDENIQHINAYPQGIKVTPQLLESIEQLAKANNLRLESLSPDEEKDLGEVFEVSIKCTWQGDLEACVRFLYALQSAGGKYKVRSLTIAPTGKSAMLKGSFTVDCAYARINTDVDVPLQVTPVQAPE